jgi:CheY-like chemotaxis protein
MGFELRTAASGHDCLDLLAAGYRPDVIFMDLAMPGIDGWETLRRVRGIRHEATSTWPSSPPMHLTRALENDAGILPEDFILKPVRHTELIDWLERRLALTWRYDAQLRPTALLRCRRCAPRVLPDASQLAALLEVVNAGFLPRHHEQLAEIERQQPDTAGFCGRHARAGAAVPV